MTRVRLRIDRITIDQPGLDRAALETEMRHEIGRLLSEQGTDALGSGGYRAQVRADLPAGTGTLTARVAAATAKAVKP